MRKADGMPKPAMMTDQDLEDVWKLFRSKQPFNHRAWGVILVLEIRELKRQLRKERLAGIRLAAEVARDYDHMSYHGYLVSECILGKLNAQKWRPHQRGFPRKNPAAKRIVQALDRLEAGLDRIQGQQRFILGGLVPGKSRK